MIELIALIAIVLIAFAFGYTKGHKRGVRKVIDQLQIPKGSEIASVSYRRKENSHAQSNAQSNAQ